MLHKAKEETKLHLTYYSDKLPVPVVEHYLTIFFSLSSSSPSFSAISFFAPSAVSGSAAPRFFCRLGGPLLFGPFFCGLTLNKKEQSYEYN